jgi:hypothetical protein|tara:strand:+ start:524 stop:724 length:201 start_codon:yes stop_codon:yes gene_type:complete
MNIRIIQATVVLFLNNAFLLLAVADPKLLKFSLIGGWLLLVIAGIYLARAFEDSEQKLSDRLWARK